MKIRENKTKAELVKEHLLKHGSISTWEAVEDYQAMRIKDIIKSLIKEGYEIEEKRTQVDGVNCTVYTLKNNENK